MVQKITSYFQEALEELHHIRWPTRQQAVRLSIIVIIFTTVVSLAFGILDFALSKVVHFLISFSI